MTNFTIHPELAATDLNRAARWYREMLGLEPVTDGGDPVTLGQTEFESELLYDTGTAKFGVYQSPNAGTNKATAARIVVEDFDAFHVMLIERGAVFETYDIEEHFSSPDGSPYWDRGALVFPDGEKTAWIKDSEGNILGIGSN